MGVHADFGTYQTQVLCAVRPSVCVSVFYLTVVKFVYRKIHVLGMFISILPFQVFAICIEWMA